MLIHIFESVTEGQRAAIEQQIREAGHEIGGLPCASYVVGRLGDPWHKVDDPRQRIILKHPQKVDSLPAGAAIVSDVDLSMIDSPDASLADWLRNAPDPLELVK